MMRDTLPSPAVTSFSARVTRIFLAPQVCHLRVYVLILDVNGSTCLVRG
jgi:hypothetical protein